MILYMDVYITNTPLFKNLYDDLAELRSRVKIYNTPSKIDATLYTLASYAIYPWSNVLIKYDLDDKTKYEYFENEVKKIFPKAILIRGRSDNQKKYQEAIKIIEKLGDEWVFYCGNNDHPFVFSDMSILEDCLAKAIELSKKYKFVSIWYSHTLESAGYLSKKKWMKYLNPNNLNNGEIIFENEKMYVIKLKEDFFCSTQILHINLLKHWFFSADFGTQDIKIRRSDDLGYLKNRFPVIDTREQIMILPKKRICEHFDGYGNLSKIVGFDVNELVPPLFIPPGFFENDIRITFGYNEYREGWVNINPLKKKYSFSDPKNGTDLKIGLSDLPLFWKVRITKIDINPSIDFKELEHIGNENARRLASPWPTSFLYVTFCRFIIAPLFLVKKFLVLTWSFLEDPSFLEQSRQYGNPLFRLYKNFLFSIVKLFKKPSK